MFKVQKDKKKKSILRMRGRGDMASSMTSLVQPYEEGQICARGHLILDSSELDSDLRLGSNRTSSITTFLLNSWKKFFSADSASLYEAKGVRRKAHLNHLFYVPPG